jgi:hypothetical protein
VLSGLLAAGLGSAAWQLRSRTSGTSASFGALEKTAP